MSTGYVGLFGAVLAGYGITSIPSALYRYRAQLGLSPTEGWLLGALFSYRWNPTIVPYPTIRTLVSDVGLSRSTIQRLLVSLEERRFLTIEKRRNPDGSQAANGYQLQPTLDQLEALVREEKAEQHRPSTGRPQVTAAIPPPGHSSDLPKVDISEDSEGDSEKRMVAAATAPLRESNADEEIAPVGALPVASLFETYADLLKRDTFHTAEILRDAYSFLFARAANVPRLGHMAKAHGAGEVLRALIKAAADWRGVDEPLDLAQKIISAKGGNLKEQGRVAPTYLDVDSPEYLAKRREDEEWERRTRPPQQH